MEINRHLDSGQGLAATDTDISPDPTSPIKTFGPGNQSLLRVLEQGEQLHSMFRCARIQGLDTMEGLLLFGSYNFYIIDGFTLLKTKEIRDLGKLLKTK
jgi:hypothetical protein